MRNRQLIAMWVFEKGKGENVIERKEKEGKTYFVINDYKKLQALFGELLAEIQRVKSEGDFQGAKLLVENYAVKVEPELHKEVLTRYGKLGLAPYSGFVNPVYKVEKDAGGNITNITLDFSEDYITQMLRYSKEHSWLPVYN
jgi:dipeptidyl-peptidase-3